jgi:hypothetical protein
VRAAELAAAPALLLVRLDAVQALRLPAGLDAAAAAIARPGGTRIFMAGPAWMLLLLLLPLLLLLLLCECRGNAVVLAVLAAPPPTPVATPLPPLHARQGLSVASL